MLSMIRRRLTYANVAMTLALVFAMSGGAYAAGKFLITSTKQIKPSVLSALKGKSGPAGPAGTAGAVGPAGGVGPAGPAGPKGENGSPGGPGVNGESVVNTKLSKGATCPEGGAEFKVGSGTATHACNGKEGSPWTAGGSLPHGSTETGVWGLNTTTFSGVVTIPISFTIPLAASLDIAHVHLIGSTEPTPAGCLGSQEKPEAEPGNLCVWGNLAGEGEPKPSLVKANPYDPENNEKLGAGKTGVLLSEQLTTLGVYGSGDWAVSGP